MPDWTTFAGFTGVVLAFLLLLARASQGYVEEPSELAAIRGEGADPPADDPGGNGVADPDTGREEAVAPPDVGPEAPDDAVTGPLEPREPPGRPSIASQQLASRDVPSTVVLLANVAVSQLVFGLLLAFGAWFASIPLPALGLGARSPTALGIGVGLGVALYLANQVGAAVADRLGVGHSDRLRELLAPESAGGWAFLLVVVLPVIAGFEDFLFRAALVGAMSTGFGVSPWIMVGASSLAFGVGHGAQGKGGIAVTTALGVVLAAAFVLTGSFLAVFVAHYLVNALEFVVHEGLGVEWIE